MIITNKTRRPLRVPLPGGKVLHLGPSKTGHITPKAAEHPALQKLVEAGELEISGPDRHPGGGIGGSGAPSKARPGGSDRPGAGGIRHVGDR